MHENQKLMNSIEYFWDELLSRDPFRINKSYEELSDGDQQAVVDHLIAMTTEEGWHTAPKTIRSNRSGNHQ